jgi:5-methylcytosine-specific restriction endonuclease McrA
MFINKFFHAVRKVHSQIREIGKGHLRSSHWPAARNKFLEEQDYCAACGSHKHLQVHHIKPFHLDPSLELNPENFIALCMDTNECHLKIGHGDSFQYYNPNVKEDAAKFRLSSADERKTISEGAKANRLKD